MYYLYDWTFVLLLPAIAVTIYAQWKVSSALRKGSKIKNSAGLTGKEVAEMIMKREGITDVKIQITV